MKVQVNGEPRDLQGGCTVGDLLRDLEIDVDRVAVEVNLEVLEKDRFEARELHEGDRIEILSFMGGGTAELGEWLIW